MSTFGVRLFVVLVLRKKKAAEYVATHSACFSFFLFSIYHVCIVMCWLWDMCKFCYATVCDAMADDVLFVGIVVLKAFRTTAAESKTNVPERDNKVYRAVC